MAYDSATIIYSNPLISADMAEQVGKQIFGLTYTPCRLTLRGRPHMTAGDIIRAYDSKGEVHNVLVMEHSITISGGLKSVISCPGEVADDAEFYSSSPTGQQVQQISKSTSEQLKAYANTGDARVLQQAKAYADELFGNITNLNEVSF